LQASGEAVGLPFNEPGNSEVGHTTLGAGRIIYQNLPRITQAIWNNSFFENPALLGAVEHAKKNNSNLHLLGLASTGGVHSYLEHLYALLELAKRQNFDRVYIHAFLDGRDTEQHTGINFISQIEEGLKTINFGKIATISGRFYAMDRDDHWERIIKTYAAIVLGQSESSNCDAVQAVKESYLKKIYDEEFIPAVLLDEKTKKPVVVANDRDAFIFFNFRPDRARELTKSFVLDGLSGFNQPKKLKNIYFATMTEYEKGLPVHVAFPPETIEYSLPRIISEAGLTQLHLAETEKYAHVTFFFGGSREEPFPGQENFLVPSPRIPSYIDQPEMSSSAVTEKLIAAINSEQYDFIIVNYANPDMIGHTGNFKAGIKAVESVDNFLGQVVPVILAENGFALVTADHGNVEEMVNLQTGEVDKEHSTNPVPCILISSDFVKQPSAMPDLSKITPAGILGDVAPTILKIMRLEQPPEMTGRALL